MKTRLIFVRHAEGEGNHLRLFHGWSDGGITDKGHLQAKKAAERLKDTHVDIIYSSSLKRTLETAQYISKIKNLPIIRTDKLKEINGGDWEGQNWVNLAEKWPEVYDAWEFAPHKVSLPNGENMVDFKERVLKEVNYIIENNRGKNILIVTHGTVIKALLCVFHGCSLEEMAKIPWCDNTAVTIVDCEDGSFKIVLEGDASHLEKEHSTIMNQDWKAEYQEGLKKRKINESCDSDKD